MNVGSYSIAMQPTVEAQETLNDNSPVQAAVSFSDTASQATAAYADRPAAAASFAVSSAAIEFLPGFSAAAASVPVFPATPVIMPGVYGSVSNYPAAGYDYLNGNKISQMVPGGVQNLEGTGVFLGGRYSMEEVIGFGGISHADSLVRSSERIRRQYNADDTQLDRAIQLTEAKNKGSSLGYSFGYPLDSYVVFSPSGGAAPGHGYWVQPFGNGCSGYIQPIRVAG